MLSKEIALAALVTAGISAPAAAAPLSPASAAAVAGAAVETVAYGCGPGFAPNAWGHCRPIYRPYGYYGPRRYGYYGPRSYGPAVTVGVPGARFSFY